MRLSVYKPIFLSSQSSFCLLVIFGISVPTVMQFLLASIHKSYEHSHHCSGHQDCAGGNDGGRGGRGDSVEPLTAVCLPSVSAVIAATELRIGITAQTADRDIGSYFPYNQLTLRHTTIGNCV